MPAERRGQVIAVGIGATGNGRSPMINGRRQPSSDGTSRMTRECQVRICEGLEVQFLGPTRPVLVFPTYTVLPLGVTTMANGSAPTGIGGRAVLVAVRIGVTVLSTPFGT